MKGFALLFMVYTIAAGAIFPFGTVIPVQPSQLPRPKDRSS